MSELTNWLLEGPAWVRYRTRVDLLKQKEDHPDVRAARKAMLADPPVRALVKELGTWPGSVLNSHKSAGDPIHQLTFLADIGLSADDPGMDKIIARILKHQSSEGPFQVLVNIPVHFGGTGKDQWAWALCDAPLIVYALTKFGLGDDPCMQAAISHLTNLVRDNGWPCAVSKELGKFRGPGRKDDPCPYANLIMLKALAQQTKWRNSRASHTGAETLAGLVVAEQNAAPVHVLYGHGLSQTQSATGVVRHSKRAGCFDPVPVALPGQAPAPDGRVRQRESRCPRPLHSRVSLASVARLGIRAKENSFALADAGRA